MRTVFKIHTLLYFRILFVITDVFLKYAGKTIRKNAYIVLASQLSGQFPYFSPFTYACMCICVIETR